MGSSVQAAEIVIEGKDAKSSKYECGLTGVQLKFYLLESYELCDFITPI